MLGAAAANMARASRRRAALVAPVLPFSTGYAGNIPAAGIATHANSATWVTQLVKNTEFLATLQDFTLPVYLASAATTTRTLHNLQPTWHGAVADGATLPWNGAWLPTGGFWNGSGNADAMMIILFDVAANGFAIGTEIDLWQVVDNSPSAGTITCSSASIVPQSYITGNGRSEVSRRCGLANRGMLGMAAEAQYGAFNHALPLSVPNTETTTAPLFIPPAIKSTTSPGTSPGIPEGARFVLTMTDAARDAFVAALPAGVPAGMKNLCKISINCFRDYGFMITDDSGTWTSGTSSGTGAHFWYEDLNSGGAIWTALGCGSQVTVSGKVYPDHLFDGLFTSGNMRVLVDSSNYASVDQPAFSGEFATPFSAADATSGTTHTFVNIITPQTGNVAVCVAARNGGAATSTVAATLGGVALTQRKLSVGAAIGLDCLWVGTTSAAQIGSALDLVVTTSQTMSQMVVFAVDVTNIWGGTTGGTGGNVSNASVSTLAVTAVTAVGANKTWLAVANTMNSARVLSASGWTALGAPKSVGSGVTGSSDVAQLFFQNSTLAVGASQSCTATWTGGASNPSGVVIVEFL